MRKLQVVSEQISPGTMWFGDEPNRSWCACNAQDWRGPGVIIGAQGMTMSDSWHLLSKPNHIGMRDLETVQIWDCMVEGRFMIFFLVLPIPTKCIFFSVAHFIRNAQLSMLDLEQFWDGWTFWEVSRKVYAKKTRVGLWGQSTILKVVLDVIHTCLPIVSLAHFCCKLITQYLSFLPQTLLITLCL